MSASPERKRRVVPAIVGLAGVLGTVVAILALSPLVKYPNVKVMPSPPLRVSYHQREGQLELGFNLVFDNQGSGGEVLRNINATLTNSALHPEDNSMPFNASEILFLEGDTEMGRAIEKDSTKNVKCVIRKANLGKLTRAVVETKGDLQLQINLVGKKKYWDTFGSKNTYQLKFCFESDGRTL